MRILKKTSILLLVFCALSNVSAQQVLLYFPAAAERQMNLYYFSGARADTITAVLDAAGNAVFTLPIQNYRGAVVLGSQEFGFVELVLAEPVLRVENRANVLDFGTVETINSAENDYLRQIFGEQNLRMQQLMWLEQGEIFHPNLNSRLVSDLQRLKTQTQQAIDRAEVENSRSPLFSARYYEAMQFMNRLFEAEHTAFSQHFTAVTREMETAEVIPTLYRLGNMWLQMHNRYISLFNRVHLVEGLLNHRQRYVESIINTLQNLQSPYYEGFLAGSIMETERFGWIDSRDSILAHVVRENPNFTTNIPSLQFSLNSFFMRREGTLPEIFGLTTPLRNEKFVLVFNNSDCGFCMNEMQTLIRRYVLLNNKNIRVVSIDGDHSLERCQAENHNFPWMDRICDPEGVNFDAFGVMATPTFLVISETGKIIAEFNDANELVDSLVGD